MKRISIGKNIIKQMDELGLIDLNGDGNFKLAEYQEKFVRDFFVYDIDIERGMVYPVFNEGVLMTGKGWGKTPVLSYISIALLHCNTMPVVLDDGNIGLVNRKQNIYIVSNTVDQSQGVLRNAQSLIGRDNPALNVRKDFIRSRANGKSIEIVPLTSSLEGLVGCTVLDQTESMTRPSAKAAYEAVRRNALKNKNSVVIQAPNTPEITSLKITDDIYDNPGSSVAEKTLKFAINDPSMMVHSYVWDGKLDSLRDGDGTLNLKRVEKAVEEYYSPILDTNGGHFPSSSIPAIAKQFESNFTEQSRFFLGIASGMSERSLLTTDQAMNVSSDEPGFDLNETTVKRILAFDGSYGRREGTSAAESLRRIPDSTSMVMLYVDTATGKGWATEVFRESPPPVIDQTIGWTPDRDATMDALEENLQECDHFIYDSSGWESDIDIAIVKTRSKRKSHEFKYSYKENYNLSDTLLDFRQLLIDCASDIANDNPYISSILIDRNSVIPDDLFHADMVPRKYGYALAKKSKFGAKIDGAQSLLLAMHKFYSCMKEPERDSGIEEITFVEDYFEIL